VGFFIDHKMTFLINQIGQKFGPPKKLIKKIAQIVNIKM
jgi:hypothetical protein